MKGGVLAGKSALREKKNWTIGGKSAIKPKKGQGPRFDKTRYGVKTVEQVTFGGPVYIGQEGTQQWRIGEKMRGKRVRRIGSWETRCVEEDSKLLVLGHQRTELVGGSGEKNPTKRAEGCVSLSLGNGKMVQMKPKD